MKERQSNFELMRLVAMFLIVLAHVLSHGKLMSNTEGILQVIVQIIACFTVMHVNSFILVSGFFQYKQEKHNKKKILNLFLLLWFYKFVIALIFYGFHDISLKELLIAFFPLDNGNYWFIDFYLLLMLLIPYLNKIIVNLDKKSHWRLLITLFVCFSIIPLLTTQSVIPNSGFTLIQFIFLYFIGAYIAKYNVITNYKLVQKRKMLLLVIIGCCLLNATFFFLGQTLSANSNTIVSSLGNMFVSNNKMYSNPLVLIQSICFFLFFGTFSLKNKLINLLASSMLGIYLIHDNYFVRLHLYKWLQIDQGHILTNPNMIFYAIAMAFVIFVTCLLIEMLRRKICKIIINLKNKKKGEVQFHEKTI